MPSNAHLCPVGPYGCEMSKRKSSSGWLLSVTSVRTRSTFRGAVVWQANGSRCQATWSVACGLLLDQPACSAKLGSSNSKQQAAPFATPDLSQARPATCAPGSRTGCAASGGTLRHALTAWAGRSKQQ